jgi:hypothetical protein
MLYPGPAEAGTTNQGADTRVYLHCVGRLIIATQPVTTFETKLV